MTSTCIACAIASGQSPAHIIHQNDPIICFLDRAPINPGHILICPRAHLADLTDLPDDLIAEIATTAKDMAQLLKDRLDCDGVSLLQNNGAFNDLGHFHLHVFPRHVGDGFRWVSDQNGNDDSGALTRVGTILFGDGDGHGPSLRTDSHL
ncbi:HIT family protein [Stenotrophomonas sp.]|uniref:HIT family protein n=1 Tax=Stenotrophomonas sp. TaxID=69392 RepID=UPI0028AD2DF6|nr:HIT family protein [Stenotrophomonas sp.]